MTPFERADAHLSPWRRAYEDLLAKRCQKCQGEGCGACRMSGVKQPLKGALMTVKVPRVAWHYRVTVRQ